MVRGFLKRVPGKRLLAVTGLSLVVAVVAATGAGMATPTPKAEAGWEIRCRNFWSPKSCEYVYVDYCIWEPYGPRC